MAYLGQRGRKEIDLNEYISQNIDREDTFYLIEIGFWKWWSNLTVNEMQLHEKQTVIDNRKLLVANHQFRVKDSMAFGEDFVIVPKYVFVPLSKWYACNAVIKRSVHASKTFENIMRNRRNADMRGSKQNVGSLVMSPQSQGGRRKQNSVLGDAGDNRSS
jgi:hypothetical protein